MGVAGLWDVIRPAGKTRSLTELSVTEGFEANPDGVRGFRVGIDASIWFFHAEYGKEGENPVLRTLFFRCATLMHSPFLPLFVFDGPKRPEWKRGKKINRTSHKLIPGMKAIVESFGFEWRMAPGEAEAELAYLNRIGVIDGILSDDVDNFLFGATTVIRNASNNLSGNRANPVLNAAGKDDKNHTKVYRMADITAHPDIQLTRGGMVLIGLLSGGDYHQSGLNRCGTVTSHGLAKCGFGDTLFQAANTMNREQLKTFLVAWRHELSHEIRTNARGHIGRKQPSLANSVPSDFPDIDILLSYTNPITSESMGRADDNLKLTWSKEPDLGKLAATCEFYFEWGYKEAIIKRFRTVIWHSAVLRILRRAVLDLDAKSPTGLLLPATPRKSGKPAQEGIGTPSKMIAKHFSTMGLRDSVDSEDDDDDDDVRLIIKIHSERKHVSTDEILEYRLEIAPAQLVRIAEAGIKGTRSPEGPDEWADEDEDDGKGAKKTPPDPESHMRVWMPASMVRLVEPRLVEQYEAVQQGRRDKKTVRGRGKVKAKAAATDDDNDAELDDLPVSKPKKKALSKPNPKAQSKHPVADADNSRPETDELERLPSRVIRDLTKKSVRTAKVDLKTFFPTTKSSSSAPGRAPTQPKVPDSRCIVTTLDTFHGAVPQAKHIRPNAIASCSRITRCVNVSSDEDSDPSLPLKSMLVSPTKPNPLAGWNKAPPGLYVSVSDSDDNFLNSPHLGCDDSHLYDSDDPFDARPSPPKPKSRLKQARKQQPLNSGSSGSDVPSNQHIHKSPRKSVTHTSPRKDVTGKVAGLQRPSSPSLAKVNRRPVKGVKYPLPIIEISDSDSDDELPPAPRFQLEPPLLRARARVEAKTTGKQASLDDCTSQLKKQESVTDRHNIIDLT